MNRWLCNRRSFPRLQICIAFVTISLVLASCSTLPRPERSDAQLREQKKALIERQTETLEHVADTVVTRLEMIQSGATADSTYDVLLLSGGGDWGVFGAAFLNGWFENQELPIPEFDYVAGISTGSLIAAYTISGERERYLEMEQFYLATDEDFISLRGPLGLGILPLITNSFAIADTSRVEAAVRGAIDDRLVADILRANQQNRVLVAGAVNLDLGLFTPFYLGPELEVAQSPTERLTKILLASSAIPAAFQPVEIEGDLYADGGASVGIPIFKLEVIPTIVERYRKLHGKAPPTFRFWLIFNNKLGVRPQVTARGWSDVLLRSYKVALQTTLVAPFESLGLTADLLEQSGQASIELRWVAIPEDFEEVAANAAFVPQAMQDLSSLGREMGGDAASWQTRRLGL
ncbi:MAG: patatin-like phospholipase family protein [Alphaproteobacteria bacterium]|nr:patatin-like phospholipase family protein [Alphaproteobacteria bacterium]